MAAASLGVVGGGRRAPVSARLLAVVVVVLLLQERVMCGEGYGLSDFLAAYNNPSVSQHEVRGDITLRASLPALERSLILVGKGRHRSRPVVIDGASKFGGIVTTENITLINLEFRNFRSAGDGGALSATGEYANIDRCIFRSNRAGDSGGALYFYSTALRVRRSQFIGNRAASAGGAIYTLGDDFGPIEDCVFEGNSAERGGAAGFRQEIGIWIRKCTFRKNRANKEGGAIFFSRGLARVSDTRFIDNVAGSFGGAFRFFGDDQGVLKICRGNSYAGNKAKPASSNNVYLNIVGATPESPNVYYCKALPASTLVDADGNGGVSQSCSGC